MQHIKAPAFWFMLLLAIASAVLSLNERYDVTVGMDEVWDVRNAYNLVHEGEMPLHSGVSGLFAMIPPGVSFAYVPGILLSPGNPAAAERIGASLMFFGTLLGIYFWINKRLGFWPTALTMLVFSAGSVGAFFQTSLWPRAHPFFYVWMLYMLVIWVERRDGRFLAASLIIFAAGMYWYMEMAPALFVVPVLYFIYHPPIRWRWQFAALAIGVLLWSPYLAFETQKDFKDFKCLLTQKAQSDFPPLTTILYDQKNHLVDASFVKKTLDGSGYDEITENTNVEDCDRWFTTEEWGTVWFQIQERWYLGEPGYVFYSDKLGGWTFQSVTSGRIIRQGHKDWEPEWHAVAFPTTRKPALNSRLGLENLKNKLMAFAPVNCLAAGGSFTVFTWHVLATMAAFAYVFYKCKAWKLIVAAVKYWFGVVFRRQNQNPYEPTDNSATWCAIILGAIVPALVLSIILRNDSLFDGERRFWWIWGGNALAIGCALGTARLKGWRIAVPAGIMLTATLSLNARTAELLGGAFKDKENYKGANAEIIDKLADVMKQDGKTEAYIGYDMNLYSWQMNTRVIDGCSKSFVEWDQVLLMRHGIRNLDNTAEGLSPRDEYIIRNPEYGYVSSKNSVSAKRWSMTIDGSLPEMEIIAKTGCYEILRKKPQQSK